MDNDFYAIACILLTVTFWIAVFVGGTLTLAWYVGIL